MGINYDEKLLAARIGGDAPPLMSQIDKMTARALTDSDESRGEKPEWRFNNAKGWLERAYNDGKEAGKMEERANWERKILGIFGVRL
jgi:hypothetical protein